MAVDTLSDDYAILDRLQTFVKRFAAYGYGAGPDARVCV